MPEGGEEEPEIVNLFEKIMKENSPSLVKEIDIQGTAKRKKERKEGKEKKRKERKRKRKRKERNRHASPGRTECPKQVGPKEDHSKTS